jgi:hypothetical protein
MDLAQASTTAAAAAPAELNQQKSGETAILDVVLDSARTTASSTGASLLLLLCPYIAVAVMLYGAQVQTCGALCQHTVHQVLLTKLTARLGYAKPAMHTLLVLLRLAAATAPPWLRLQLLQMRTQAPAAAAAGAHHVAAVVDEADGIGHVQHAGGQVLVPAAQQKHQRQQQQLQQ